jgi:hypothetical protein
MLHAARRRAAGRSFPLFCFTPLYCCFTAVRRRAAGAALCFTALLRFTALYSALLLYAGALQAQNPCLLAYVRRLLYMCIYISACFTLLYSALLCFTTVLYFALLLYAGALRAQNPYLLAYVRRLLKGPPEHNWGLRCGSCLPLAPR